MNLPKTDRVEDETLRVAEGAVAALTPIRDDKGLAFAWSTIGQSREALGELTLAAAAYQQARDHALRTTVNSNGVMLAWGSASVLLDGPTPISMAIPRCRELVDWRGNTVPGVLFVLAELHALNAEFDEARAVLARAASAVRRWGGHRTPLFLALSSARVHVAGGDIEWAEQQARHGLDIGAALGGTRPTSPRRLFWPNPCAGRTASMRRRMWSQHT